MYSYYGFRQPAVTFTLYSCLHQWPKSTFRYHCNNKRLQRVPQIRNSKIIELTVKWGVPNSLPQVHTHSELNPPRNFQLRFIQILFITSQSSLDLACALFLKMFYDSLISPLSATIITIGRWFEHKGIHPKRVTAVTNVLPFLRYPLCLTGKTNYFNTGSFKLYLKDM